MASRSLDDLYPRMKERTLAFLERCKAEGIDVLIYCTYRSNTEQNDLYEQGRTLPGKRVTNARGGQSAHNFTLDGKPAAKAFDCVPLRGGKPMWSASDPLWKELGRIGKSVGLDWAGNWRTFREFPHFQLKEE
jgi:peptidoglycan L-alanyl-D-glutamate endopeptidase CwlK